MRCSDKATCERCYSAEERGSYAMRRRVEDATRPSETLGRPWTVAELRSHKANTEALIERTLTVAVAAPF
jgi:hypothetical protein